MTDQGREGRVLIVGAGIAGLTLAQAMTRRRLPFDLIEKVARPAPVGAGITLVYNALRLLDALGLGAALRERGTLFDGARIASVSGTVLQQASVSRVYPQAQSLGIHRAELHEVLSRGILVEWDKALKEVQPGPQGVRVTLQGGAQTQQAQEQRHYALVLGADGLHSAVRAAAFPSVGTRYAGYTCWRFVTDFAFHADPVEWWGQGRRLGLTSIGRGQTYGYATLNRAAGVPDPVTGRAERLRAMFADFPEQAAPVLARVQDAEVIHHDLYELTRHCWHLGRVGLLGDAAHAMTPNMGQGAGMGMEDAVALAEALRVHGPTPRALETYSAVRRGRVQGMADASRLIGRAGQLEHPVLRGLRDFVLGHTPGQLADQQLAQRLFAAAPAPPAYGR